MKSSLAIDLGTTTIALCSASSSKKAAARAINPQRLYGSDVLSRMKNAARFNLSDKLKSMAKEAILDLAASLGILPEDILEIYLSANTPMTHLFWGLDVSGMLSAPFSPETLCVPEKDWEGIPVFTFPGISAFIGGDIVSGIYSLSLLDKKSPCLFVDLGTNGEIVLFIPNEGLLSASVAAGPCFEGGNISIGMPAVSGAIDSLSIKKGFCRIHTVEECLPPKGLCGSGLIEAVYELFSDGIIDSHGSFLNDSFREEGFPLYAQNLNSRLLLSQKDIRALQMAKGAVYAGIKALCSKADLRDEDISTLYLAGSFGEHLDIKKASGIGLIPKALVSKTISVQNTSLAGALRLALNPEEAPLLCRIVSETKYISLADSPVFKEEYIRAMDLTFS